MSEPAGVQPGLNDRLQASEAQLQVYARDFRAVLAAQKAKAAQLEAANRQLERYARDLQSAFVGEQARCRELEKAHRGTLLRLLRAARFKDDETASHLRRIQHLCRLVATHFWWNSEEVQRLVDASPMHDIGKIGVPDAILHKAGPLTSEEWRIMKKHPAYGALLLNRSGSPLLEMARDIAYSHRERCLHAGMDGYVAKPIRAQLLFDTIEDLLHAASATSGAAAASTTALNTTSAATSGPEQPVLNEEELLDRVGHDAGLLREMIAILEQSAPGMLHQIESALQQEDPSALLHAAHALKGSVSNFAAHGAYDAASRLEELGQSRDMSEAQQSWQRMQNEMALLQESLSTLATKYQAA